MQISDLLGKYGQNTVPVTAQEQAVKTGTQQLTGTLSSLQTGNVFEGTVTDISDGQVLLTLANGEKISARLEGQIQLQLNQAMFFEVKSNTQTQIAIKPYLNGDSSNPTLLKALLQAGMGVTTDNLEMVRTMMEEQLPIDKNSLNQMMRQLAMFPKAEPSVIAQMNKLGIPVTEANVQQFSNYKADTAAIMKELENVLEQLPKSIAGEGDTDDSKKYAVDGYSVWRRNDRTESGYRSKSTGAACKNGRWKCCYKEWNRATGSRYCKRIAADIEHGRRRNTADRCIR